MKFLRDHEITIFAAVLIAVVALTIAFINDRFASHPKGWIAPAVPISDEEIDAKLEIYHRESRWKKSMETRRDREKDGD